MNLPGGLLPLSWQWLAWLLLLPLVLRSFRRAPWQRLAAGGSHVWFGAIVVLTLLWSMRAGVHPGLELHLLGATALTLMFGFHLACLGMLAVLAASSANGAGDWSSYGVNAWLTAILPCAATMAGLRLVERLLPRNLFVYLFAGAFANAALVIGIVGLTSAALLRVASVYDGTTLVEDFLSFLLLLGFSEAWLTGALITLFVVYLPSWVSTFEDERYLRRP